MIVVDREWLAPRTGQASGANIVGKYRYLLWRTWDHASPRLLWVLLNPSIADGQTDDPTVRRCMRFSQDWRYGGLEIVNLFALRTPYPQALRRAADPVGSENDRYVAAAMTRAGDIVVAWGEYGTYQRRDRVVLGLLSHHAAQPPLCFGSTRNGSPRHPLYLARSASLVSYWRDGVL
jgi:hypothetical protein